MPVENHSDADDQANADAHADDHPHAHDHAHADDHTHAQGHAHSASRWGQVFLWGGIGLGILLVAFLLTNGFGLLRKSGNEAEGPAMMVRQGDKIIVPEGSPLRERLSVQPAAAEAIGAKLVLPGIVESDPSA